VQFEENLTFRKNVSLPSSGPNIKTKNKPAGLNGKKRAVSLLGLVSYHEDGSNFSTKNSGYI
jgi:hypothetical protein